MVRRVVPEMELAESSTLLLVLCIAASIPDSDATSQNVLHGASIEICQSLWWHTKSPQTPNEIEPLACLL